MHHRQLIMSEQSLHATPIRDSDDPSVRMPNRDRLEYTSDRVPDTIVHRHVDKKACAPLYERLYDVDLRGERRNRDLLGTKVDDRHTTGTGGPSDVSTETVHGPDRGVAFHRRQSDTPDSHRPTRDAPHRVRQSRFGRVRLFEGAE